MQGQVEWFKADSLPELTKRINAFLERQPIECIALSHAAAHVSSAMSPYTQYSAVIFYRPKAKDL